MILSKKRRFLFLKTKKTASTSVEIALSHDCGAEDIVTPLTPEDEIKRYLHTGTTAQNFSRDPELEAHVRKLVVGQELYRLEQLWPKLRESSLFYNHIPYDEIINYIAPQQLDLYRIITVERCPQERILSFIRYRLRGHPVKLTRLKQSLLILLLAPRRSFQNIQIYSSEGKIVITDLIQFAQLQHDVDRLMTELKIPLGIPLIRTKDTRGEVNVSTLPLTDVERWWVAKFNNTEMQLCSSPSVAPARTIADGNSHYMDRR